MTPILVETLALQQVEQQIISPMLLLIRIAEAGIVALATYIIAKYIIGYIPKLIPAPTQPRFIYSFIAIIRYIVYAVGALIALAIIAPEPGVFSALILVLGIGVIIAFSDLLRNWGAEIYVRSFTSLKIGDQVEVMGREGTIIHMDSRGVVIETPTREKIYVPNIYLASAPIINRTSPYGTTYRIKIMIPAEQDTDKAYEAIKGIISSIRPELVEDPIVTRKGIKEGFAEYEASVVLLNVRKIGYIVSQIKDEIERTWPGARVYT
jgi:small-conductance mechanosensitive channel